MPRLQVLQLPDQDEGERTVTPFALVVDEVTGAEADRLWDHTAEGLASTGAASVLVFPNMTVTIPDNDTSAFRNAEPIRQALLTSHEAEREVQLARGALLAEYGSDAGPLVDVLIRSVRRCYTGTEPADPAGT